MSTARANDRAEPRARQQRLAGDDRNAARAPNLGKCLDVLGLAGLFEPIGLELGKRIGEIDGVHRGEPPVHLNEDIDVWTDGVALPARRGDRREVLSSSGSGSILS
jgi:hypothetical protein